MNTPQKEIIIADSLAICRIGLITVLKGINDYFVFEESETSDELMSKMQARAYDILLLSDTLDGMASLDLIKMLKSRYPQLLIIVFSHYSDEPAAIRFIKAGVSACVSKAVSISQLSDVVKTVSNGRKYLSSNQVEILTSYLSTSDYSNPDPHNALSDREFQVMNLLVSGNSKTEIAGKLKISKNTVGNHRNNILKKLNLDSNAELVKYAIQSGLIQ
jgi:two-component system, NarL family, invasion response regulator UvrY